MAIYDHNQGINETRESAKAFEAFTIYLELGPDRSTAKVAEMLGCTPNNVKQWAKRNNWVDRSAAFDADRVRERFKAIREEREEKHREDLIRFSIEQENRAIGLADAGDLLLTLVMAKLNAMVEGDVLIQEDNIDKLLRVVATLGETSANLKAAALGVDELVNLVDQELES